MNSVTPRETGLQRFVPVVEPIKNFVTQPDRQKITLLVGQTVSQADRLT